MDYAHMGLNEWLLIAGTVLGPVLAVQAQKWIERSRESRNRKTWVFYTLMATRGARLADDHVRALNSIDLVFFGMRFFGRAWRSRESQAVIDAWHEYHGHLNLPDAERPKTIEESKQWQTKGEELFLNLLAVIAAATGHEFSRQTLRTGSYSPQAHASREIEQEAVRRLSLEVLTGQRPLPMDVKGFPTNEQFITADAKFKVDVVEALQRIADGKGHGEQS